MARSKRKRWVGALAGVLCLALGLPAGGEESITSPEFRRHFDRFSPEVAERLGVKNLKAASNDFAPYSSGTLLIDSGLDRGYQLFVYEDETQGMTSAIVEIDLSTLKPTGLLKIPDRGLALPGPGSVGFEFLSALDTKAHKLYLVSSRGGGLGGAANRPEILAVNLRTLEYTMNELPLPLESGAGLAAVFGMSYDTISDNLILLVPPLEGSPAFTANPVAIVGWPSSAFDGGLLPVGPEMLGPRLLRNCRRDPVNSVGLNTDKGSPIMITRQPDPEANLEMKTWVLIPCLTTPVSFSSSLIRLNHSTLFDRNATDERVIPAPPGITNWAMDQRRGRFLLVNESEGADGWVYEASSNAYIGVIQLAGTPAGKSTGFGVDEGSGRLYAFNGANGMMIAEMGQDPLPQADTFRLRPAASGWQIPIDARRNRIFLLALARPDRYEVYEVPPPTNLETKNDPDELTKQVNEEPGKTSAEYGGSATAYGVRSLLAGGVAGAVPSFGNDNLGRLVKEMNSRCGLKDREVVLASIPQTELQNSAREAKAAGVQLDNASIQDLGRPSRCDVYNEVGLGFFMLGVEEVVNSLQFGSGFEQMDQLLPEPYPSQPEKSWADFFDEELSDDTHWEYEPATCSKPAAVAGNNSERLAGPTSVSCQTPDRVSAVSEARGKREMLGDLLIEVGRTYTETSVTLDPRLGLVSKATAVVEGIKIGPITIGYVKNEARSFAKGRKGTAGTDEYRPIFAGVRGPNITGCEVRCDADAIIPALNSALSGRVEFRTLKPEPSLKAGSRGGYQAGVIKSEKQRSSDNALVGDKSSEVPAIEVIIYNDNPRLGRVRQVIQLAGVHVDSQYGIQVFDEGTPCPECTGGFELFDEFTDDFGTDEVLAETPEEPTILEKLIEKVRKVIGGVAEGIQLLLASPGEAALAATVWVLLLGPYFVWRRRRLLSNL